MSHLTENTHLLHRTPNVAKYARAAADRTTWTRMVNATKFDCPNGCWEWQLRLNDGGYGLFSVYGGAGPVLAHRLALHVAGRPVPEDMTVDHLCRNRRCINPDHLDIVTRGVNSLRGDGYYAVNARKSHCAHGHEFTDENTSRSELAASPAHGRAPWFRSSVGQSVRLSSGRSPVQARSESQCEADAPGLPELQPSQKS